MATAGNSVTRKIIIDMKAIFIAFNQSYYDEVIAILDRNSVRGFTFWEEVQGRGSSTGEPHYGSHAWPTMNSALLTVVDDEKVDRLLKILRKLDKKTEVQGLRAFVWDVAQSI